MSRLTYQLPALCLALGLILPSATCFDIVDCSGGANADAKLKSVHVDVCPDAKGDYCELPQGQNATITVDFEATKPFNSAELTIKGKIMAASLPFPISPSQACGNYGLNCPIKPSDEAQLSFSLPVKRVYPRISLTVHLELNDENNKPIICVELPARIVKK